MGKTRDTFGYLYASEIYPKEGGKADMDNLGAVALRLTHDETEQLLQLLQEALNNRFRWDYLEITGYRKNNQVTVSHYIPVRNRP